MSKLQGKVRGDIEWSDIEGAHPQADLRDKLEYLRGHGFKIEETDTVFRVINPLTKKVEAEYRII